MSGTGSHYGSSGHYFQHAQHDPVYPQRPEQQTSRPSALASTSQYSAVQSHAQTPPSGFHNLQRYQYPHSSSANFPANPSQEDLRESNFRNQNQDNQGFKPHISPTLAAHTYKGYSAAGANNRTPAPVQTSSLSTISASAPSRYQAPSSQPPLQATSSYRSVPHGSHSSNPVEVQTQPKQKSYTLIRENAEWARQYMDSQRNPSPNHPTQASYDNITSYNHDRQQRSGDPTEPVTVNPNQVYDSFHEYQRQAKRAEADAAARAAEEKKLQDEKLAQEQALKAVNDEVAARDQLAIAEASRLATEGQAKGTTAPARKRTRKASGTNNTAKAKARSGMESATTPLDDSAEAAALTLMSAANGEPASKQELEAHIRAMFKRMREFNAQDPELLSRLWQQERDDHLRSDASQTQVSEAVAVVAPNQVKKTTSKPISKIKAKTRAKAVAATPLSQSPSQPMTQPRDTPNLQNSSTPSHAPQSITFTELPRVPPSASALTTHGTIWPAEKMAALASAASKILPTMPQNEGKSISAEVVSSILATNPSYVDLCVKIEALGFLINRKTFAKALLSAVPDVNEARPSGSTATAPSRPTTSGTTGRQTLSTASPLREAESRLLNTSNPIVETSSTPSAFASKSSKNNLQTKASTASTVSRNLVTNDSNANSSIDPQLQGLDAVKHFVDTAPSYIEDDLPAIENDISPPPQASASIVSKKKQKAKAAATPSEPPAPATKQELARKRTFGDLIDLTQLLDEEPEPVFPIAKRQDVGQDIHHLPSPPNTIVETGTAAPTPVATGSQPVMKGPRPATFEPVASLLPQSTSGAPGSSLPPIPYNHQARTVQLVQPLDKYKAIRTSAYDSKTIARDVLLACGRHPDMRHLNFHLESLKLAFPSVDNTSDLSTLRWDVIDPGGPPPGSGNPLPEIDVIEDDFADDEDDDADSVLDEPRPARQVVGGGGASEVSAIASRFTPGNVKTPMIKRGPGRPPKNPAYYTPNDGSDRLNTNDQTPNTNARIYRPKAVPASTGNATPNTGTPVTYAALYAASGDPKKKGRPVGWRKWMQKTPSGLPPKKPLVGSASTPEPQPEYKIYKCGWEGCNAELHNLATLRKHVHKIHLKKADHGGYDCFWVGCEKVKSFTDKATNRTLTRIEHESFQAVGEWKEHIEKQHISPIAWELGDGPAGGISGLCQRLIQTRTEVLTIFQMPTIPISQNLI